MALIAPPQTFQTILTLVQALETAYPNDSWIHTAARIRKSYYTGFFWTLLTLKSIALESPSTQQGLSQKTLTTLQKGQLIFQDAQGNSVDFRHACTAIEALASPRLNWLLRRLSGVSIPAVLSWSGDVGSVLTEYALTQGKHGSLQHYYHQYANACDLFGDIDGYALYHLGQTSPYKTSGDRLSHLIQEYYDNQLPQRFERFTQAARLTVASGNRDRQLTSQSNQAIKRQISRFTFWVVLWKMFRQSKNKSKNKLTAIVQFITHRPYTQNDANQVSQWFIQWVNQNL